MFSGASMSNAEQVTKILLEGADDFIVKSDISLDGETSIDQVLIPKIMQFIGVRRGVDKTPDSQKEEVPKDIQAETKKKLKDIASSLDKTLVSAVLIGSSTGGPDALKHIFDALKTNPKIPVFVVQHMPALFTRYLAEQLTKSSILNIREAIDGEIVEPGMVYLAPGDYHMELEREGFKTVIKLNQESKECFVRPAVNKLFRTAANVYGDRCLAIVLTGMGSDGAEGAIELKKRGAKIFVQDKNTSVVWGMPGAVVEAGVEAEVMRLNEFSNLLDNVF